MEPNINTDKTKLTLWPNSHIKSPANENHIKSDLVWFDSKLSKIYRSLQWIYCVVKWFNWTSQRVDCSLISLTNLHHEPAEGNSTNKTNLKQARHALSKSENPIAKLLKAHRKPRIKQQKQQNTDAADSPTAGLVFLLALKSRHM